MLNRVPQSVSAVLAVQLSPVYWMQSEVRAKGFSKWQAPTPSISGYAAKEDAGINAQVPSNTAVTTEGMFDNFGLRVLE